MIRFILWVFSMALVLACTDATDEVFSGNLKSGELGMDKESKMVTTPFVVEFVGTYTDPGSTTEKCDMNVIVDGNGKGTHIGNATIHFDFCVTPFFEDGYAAYGNTESYIVAANGDMIFIDLEGKVVFGRTDDHPEYVTSWWQDEFFITGGTGRFEGATGSGWTNDYNSSEDPNSHHYWQGTISMKKK